EGRRRAPARPGTLVDGIDPQPARGRSAFAWRQNLDGRVVGVDYRRAHDIGADHLDQRCDPPGEVAHPIGHYHALDLDAVAREDLGLAIERQAVVVLANSYACNEVGTWPTLEDRQIGCRRLGDHLAGTAGVDRTDVADNLELRRDLLQDLGHLFADLGMARG